MGAIFIASHQDQGAARYIGATYLELGTLGFLPSLVGTGKRTLEWKTLMINAEPGLDNK